VLKKHFFIMKHFLLGCRGFTLNCAPAVENRPFKGVEASCGWGSFRSGRKVLRARKTASISRQSILSLFFRARPGAGSQPALIQSSPNGVGSICQDHFPSGGHYQIHAGLEPMRVLPRGQNHDVAVIQSYVDVMKLGVSTSTVWGSM